MEIRKTKINFQDSRGVIRDLIVGVPIDSITLVTFNRDAIRGNHFHTETVQHDYIIKGKILCRQQSAGGKIEEAILVEGDVVTHPAGVRHAFKALEDAAMISCTHGPRQGMDFEKDTTRLSENDKLIKE